MNISERELLGAIRKVLSGPGDEVRVGVGDDAAVVATGTGELVLTVDQMVEQTHFDRSIATAREIGYRAVVVAVSDIAAMAASPRYALCALTLGDDVDAAWVMELFAGMREACDDYALWLVGGNLSRGTEISISISVTGEVARGRAVTRGGARVGDLLVVTGSLGGAAAGLRMAREGRDWRPDRRAAVAPFFRPEARVGEAGVLAAHGAAAMIDVSDGLAADLASLAEASGVGARIRLDAVPVAPGATSDDALSGGEDYELLVTLPDDAAVAEATHDLRERFGVPLTVIGEVAPSGLTVIEADGSERTLEPAGWDHFVR
jgi:thiamine-monophosphate kinase